MCIKKKKQWKVTHTSKLNFSKQVVNIHENQEKHVT